MNYQDPGDDFLMLYKEMVKENLNMNRLNSLDQCWNQLIEPNEDDFKIKKLNDDIQMNIK